MCRHSCPMRRGNCSCRIRCFDEIFRFLSNRDIAFSASQVILSITLWWYWGVSGLLIALLISDLPVSLHLTLFLWIYCFIIPSLYGWWGCGSIIIHALIWFRLFFIFYATLIDRLFSIYSPWSIICSFLGWTLFSFYNRLKKICMICSF